MRDRRPAIAVALALATLWANPASAYCRTTTCDACVQPQGGCVTEGLRLFWPVDCVSYDVQKDASRWVSLETATVVADRAFSHWTQAPCGASAKPSIALVDRGPVACNLVEYNDPNSPAGPSYSGNANVIIFRDTDWTRTNANDPASTLALTTVTFNRDSGEIYDADIEINGEKAISVGDPVTEGAYDLESILTHEAGHFLGLAHSPLACSGADCPTMNASYDAASTTFRTLEADDISGICAIYPAGRTQEGSACVPNHGFESDCGSPAPDKPSCALARPGGAARRAPLAIAALFALAGAAARRRRARAGRDPGPHGCYKTPPDGSRLPDR